MFGQNKREIPIGKVQNIEVGNKVLIGELSVTKEAGYLYYVSFKAGHLQIYKTKMARGRKKKEEV